MEWEDVGSADLGFEVFYAITRQVTRNPPVGVLCPAVCLLLSDSLVCVKLPPFKIPFNPRMNVKRKEIQIRITREWHADRKLLTGSACCMFTILCLYPRLPLISLCCVACLAGDKSLFQLNKRGCFDPRVCSLHARRQQFSPTVSESQVGVFSCLKRLEAGLRPT